MRYVTNLHESYIVMMIFFVHYRQNSTDLQRFRVRVGTSLKLEGGHLHKISACLVHPEYRGIENSLNSDVSLLKVTLFYLILNNIEFIDNYGIAG